MEENYVVLNDIEHLKKRKSVYLGEVSNITKDSFTYDQDAQTLSYKTITYNTGLLKLFDEIFANAVDNYQRTKGYKRGLKTTEIRVTFDDDYISVLNDGQSIPIEKKKLPDGSEIYVPQMLFTLLRSGSNFDDAKKRTWGGLNGMGCKIVSFLSSRFEIELFSNKTFYKQIVLDSTNKIEEPKITKVTSISQLNKLASEERQSLSDYTKITYYPIFSEFELKETEFTPDFIEAAKMRVYDVCYLPIDLYINEKQVPRLTWDEFVAAHAAALNFTKSRAPVPICIDQILSYSSNNWYCSISTLNQELKTRIPPISYVNYIVTQDSGTHVNYIVDQVSTYIKSKFSSLKEAKNIKDKLFICLSSIIPNPKFESQAKCRLTTSQKEFADMCVLPTKLLSDFTKNTPIVDILEGKAIAKKNRETKSTAIAAIPKAKDATYAGKSRKAETRLILTEGDSALTTAVYGVEHIPNGVDYFGMFPLRGKSLNVRSNSQTKYLENAELTNIKILLGLEDGKTYTSVSQLRYGGVILMTDADTDGAHIKSLIINFFDVKFPSLLKIPGFIREFITPMIKVTIKDSSQLWKTYKKQLTLKAYKGTSKGIFIYPLYNRIEFEKFNDAYLQNATKTGYEIDYIKGLATIEKSDTEQFFDKFEDSEIKFNFDDASKESLDLAFSKKREDDRKKWIGSITEDTHLERVPREPIVCTDFVNTDLCLFSFDNCVRSIPSLVDGLKPTQRKILCAMLNMGQKAYNKIKVTELGGLVTKDMKYEHGDTSMNETIIGMAQDYTGSNNINLLIPIGQFGTRRQLGEDHGSPRYVHTSLNPLARLIFPEEDDAIYEYKYEEGVKVEPIYYIPIIPMVLVNGASGIGTGWSTDIPGFDPKELTRLVIELINGDRGRITALDLPAYWKGFKGKVIYEIPASMENVKSRNPKVTVRVCSKSEKGKLPRWAYEGDYTIHTYKGAIKLDVKDASPTVSVESIYDTINKHIAADDGKVIKFTPTMFSVPQFSAEFSEENSTEDEIVKMLDLNGSIPSTNMTLFNGKGQIKKYTEIYEIIDEWLQIRYDCYDKRIKCIIDKLERELCIISNKYRFVKEIALDETLDVHNKKKISVEKELEEKKYDKIDDNYSYLLSMSIFSLTKEKLEELKNERDKVSHELDHYKEISVEELWTEELEKLMEKL